MANDSQQRQGLKGTIIESLPNDLFRVRLDDQNLVVAHIGTRRNNDFLRLLPGDRVEVQTSPDDRKRGRITQRYKS